MKDLKSMMNRLNLGAKAPRCPLCHEWMVKKFDSARQVFIFACDTPYSCEIACEVSDPFVGRWDEAAHKSSGGAGIACPRPTCQKPMRYFATKVGFMKAFCPACKATVSNSEPDRKSDPNFKESAPEAPGALQ